MMKKNTHNGSRDDKSKMLTLEFQISRKVREENDCAVNLVEICGGNIKADMRAIRILADKINKKHNDEQKGGKPLHGSYLYAAGLIDAMFHYVIGMYREEMSPPVFVELEEFLENEFGKEELGKLLHFFSKNYPVMALYRGEMGEDEYLKGESGHTPNRHIILEEIIWTPNNRIPKMYSRMFPL